MKGKRKECKGEGCLNDCPLSMSMNGELIKIRESIIKINNDICWMKKIIGDTKGRLEKIDKRMWGLAVGIIITLLAVVIEILVKV